MTPIKDSAPTDPAVLRTFSDTVQRFLDTVQINYVGFYTRFKGPSSDPWPHDLWHVVANGSNFIEDYKTGIGHRTGPLIGRAGIKMRQVLTRPNTLDAVAQLALDAAESDASFEEFARTHGYDPDSRRIFNLYEQCLTTRQALRAYLSASDLYDLSEYGRTL
jgi:hypothetical protein